MSIRRLPLFTLLLLIVVGCAGVYFGSHVGATNNDAHQVADYSIQLLIEGELQRAVTSLFITAGGWRFYSSLAMLALAVGFVEVNRGTLRALLTFFSIHFATLLLLASIILCFHALGPTLQSHLLLHTRDVGPSAGYYGCLGSNHKFEALLSRDSRHDHSHGVSPSNRTLFCIYAGTRASFRG